MQQISFRCPHCMGVFQISANMAGQQVGCPHCQGAVSIPDGPLPPDSAAPSPPASTVPVSTAPVSTAPVTTVPVAPLPPTVSTPPQQPALEKPAVAESTDFQNPPGVRPTPIPVSTPTEPAKTSTRKSSKIDSLLPPEAASVGGTDSVRPIPPTAGGQAEGLFGDSFKVSDDLDEEATSGGTPVERAKARLIKNILLFLAGLIILLVTLWLLSDAKPVIETKVSSSKLPASRTRYRPGLFRLILNYERIPVSPEASAYGSG